jgi:hypothetical protein
MSGMGRTTVSAWSSRHSPAPRIVPEWGPTLIGTLLHRAVQWVVLDARQASVAVLGRRAAAHVLPARLAVIHRLMVEQRVAQGTTVWLEEFDPRPDWRPLAVEINVGEVRIDLLWIAPDGRIRADELKSGGITARDRRQASAIDAAGVAAFGSAWAGVRLIGLSALFSRCLLLSGGSGT